MTCISLNLWQLGILPSKASQSVISTNVTISQDYLAHNLEDTSISILGATISFRTVMFPGSNPVSEFRPRPNNTAYTLPGSHQCQNEQQSAIMSFPTSCTQSQPKIEPETQV